MTEKTPLEEVDEIDRVTYPDDWRDLSAYIDRYRFPYWSTEHEERAIELVARGRRGEDRWVIIDPPYCYDKRARIWLYEPRPSSRDEEFLRDCRVTMKEARQILPRLLYKMHQNARRKMVRIVTVHNEREAQHRLRAEENRNLAGLLSAYRALREVERNE